MMNADAKAEVRSPSEGELFKKILGKEWQKLHPDIQRRFDKNPAPDNPLNYTGVLSELTCSRLGRVIGCLTRPLINGALIPYNDADFPVDIVVFSKPDCPFIYKQRTYRLHGRKPIQFTSYMQESSGGEVLEYVGKGLGMKLVLHVQDGNLHFPAMAIIGKFSVGAFPYQGFLRQEKRISAMPTTVRPNLISGLK